MVDTFTQTSSNAAAVIANALDLKVRYYLMQEPQFRQHVDSRPINPAHEGPTVTLTVHGELAAATTPLTENVDVDARDIPATRTVDVSMAEYGATNLRTLRVETFDWSNELATTIAMQLADNQRTSMDLLVRGVLDAATNKWWLDTGGTGFEAVMPADGQLDNMGAKTVAAAASVLRARRVLPRNGDKYVGIVHPFVSYDIRREAGPNTWSDPKINVDTANLYSGYIGDYQGISFIEHNRALVATAQGTGVQTHYTSYFLGKEALLEAVAIEPHAVVGPVVDKLNRFRPLGWHGLLGWSIFRQNAIQLVKSESSLTIDLSAFDPKA